MPRRQIMSPAVQAVILVAMVVVALLLLYERWRRARRPEALTREQSARRLAGGLILEADLALWFLADLVTHRWSPATQLLYLFCALLLVFVPMYLAIRETGFVVRQYARHRSDLVRNLGRRSGGPSGNGRDRPA